MTQELSVRLLPETYTISKLPQFAEMPRIISSGEMCFTFRTDDEFSLICPDFMAPNNVQQDTGWKGIKVNDSVNYASVGVVMLLIKPLTDSSIPIVLVTSHSSCIVFVQEEKLIEATKALQHAGVSFVHKE
jgi:hypothetical protein